MGLSVSSHSEESGLSFARELTKTTTKGKEKNCMTSNSE